MQLALVLVPKFHFRKDALRLGQGAKDRKGMINRAYINAVKQTSIAKVGSTEKTTVIF
jgi:hypothetical protein